MKITVFPNLGELSAAAAEVFVARARDAVGARGRFCVSLAGGNTPQAMYELLAKPGMRERVAWKDVHVFWGDERFVPADDPMSNYRGARQALLDHVPIPAGQVHPVKVAGTPEQAAAGYQGVLEAFFGGGRARFDLVLLGMGDDGHTASLFPGTPVLEEKVRWVGSATPRGQSLARITLTAGVINEAAEVVFLVAGVGKAAALSQVIEGPRDVTRLPAQLVKPKDGELLWLVDEAAAGMLKRK